MKPFILVIFCLLGILACATFMFVEHQNQIANERALQSEIKALEAKNKKTEANYKLRGDSLTVAFTTIRNLHQETEHAKEETKIYRKKFESVKFVKFESDSARNEALKKLYKSYHNSLEK